LDEFIELNRTFYQLSADYGHEAKSDDIDISEALGLRIGNDLKWSDLLKQHRIVLLAEAGAGKTREIRYATQKLRSEDKKAFFLRLEHIVADLETAFEEGTYQEFQEWLTSNEEGWLLLDSVDESRLKDPKDFESAMRKLAHIISSASARAHIVITSRVTAWRPKTDLTNCNKYFPPVAETPGKNNDTDEEDDDFLIDKKTSPRSKRPAEKAELIGFRIYSLTNLSADQVSKFAQNKGVTDHRKFLEEIDRQDASAFTTRPQDLEEIVDFWNDKGRIGTRFELMENSVKRRLTERDQDRADAKPLDIKRIREGTRLLAAACTLTHKSTINVLDGTHNSGGLDVKSVLLDWNDQDLQILLDRPIFDKAIYGTVRFHHRSVREYLTAEWFYELLKNDGSRQRIENMFFRDQYGMQVVLPSMKPVLSWLVLFDSIIMNRIYSLEPEIILEGGDPNRLPLEKRKEILRSVCKKISLGTASRGVEDRAAVQRFASTDIADDIKQLIKEYEGNSDVVSYLLRMIWQGRIKEALSEAKGYAQNKDTQKYTMIAAIRAVKEVGTAQDFDDVLRTFLVETENQHDRRILAELIDNIGSDEKSADWILEVLENVQDKEKYNVDGLPTSLANFIERADLNAVAKILKGIDKFLKQEPFIERRFCEISGRYGWLLPISLKASERLISSKHPEALSSECLYALTQAFSFKEYDDFESGSLKNDLSSLVPGWKELNHSLFWYDVEETKRMWEEKRKDSLEYAWQVSIFGCFWSFTENDFDFITQDIVERPSLGDRLIALSLAFQLYKDNKRPKSWLSKLKNAVADNEALQQRLNMFLHPPAQSEEMKKWKKQDARWKRRSKQEEKKRQESHKKSLEWLSDNYQKLRDSGLEKGLVSHPQYYMHQKMRENSDESLATKWTAGDWKCLVEDYGLDTAQAFRDGMVSFWRSYVPILRSEKDEKDTTAFAIIFGLSGLAVEAAETPNWLESINEAEAELACKYAVHEMNGFPHWFSHLYEKFTGTVNRILLNEIDWEQQSDDAKHYMLSRISWDCKWLWDSLAPTLLAKLEKEPLNAETLGKILKIIQGSSSVSDTELAEIAANKCRTLNSSDNLSHWFAVWIGVDPESAIKQFSVYLGELEKQDPFEAKNQAMRVIVNLIGERRTGSNAREKFKAPEYLKNLYLLMHKYIKVEEDIVRAGKGAYSPGLRDDAQDARSRLFSILVEISGKESYLAMCELSASHPVEEHRVWMMHNAKKRAELDADFSPWASDKFCEFNRELESAPSNHRELFDLGVQRILDLKYQLEEGDDSIASTLAKETEERGIRKVIANWCRDRSIGKYTISQEDELADAKKPDCRFASSVFDAPVPMELKLADNWSGPKLFERLENQLNGDYLRDGRSKRGIFVLVYRGEQKTWEIPLGKDKVSFSELVNALQNHWNAIADQYPKVEQITVIGIDLTKRSKLPSAKSEAA